MLRQVMCLHVQLRLEDDKLLLQASSIGAQVVVLLEVLLQLVVVEEVVRLSRVSSIAYEATLVLHAAVLKQLVVVVEALAAETAERVALEARLVGGTRLVVTVAHVPLKLLIREELMLVGEDLLVAGAQVAHALAMGRLDVTMQIGPAQPGEIARAVGTVVPQQEDGVADDLLVCVLDADAAVGGGEVAVRVGLELLVGIVGKDDIGSWCLQMRLCGVSMVHTERGREDWAGELSTYTAMGTILGLVQRPHTQAADMARLVVARRNRVVSDGVGTDEADVAIFLVVVVGLQLGSSRCQRLVLLVGGSGLLGGCSRSSFCALLSSSLSASVAASSSSSLGTASILALISSSSASAASSSATAAASGAAFASTGG